MLLALTPYDDARSGAGSVDGNGNLELNIHFRFPPSQDDIDRVREQVQRVSDLMCDATEGNMRITKARLAAGGANEPAGDVWYYPPGTLDRSRSAGAPVHAAANRIYLSYDSIRSDVLFHESGHLVFGLSDQYNEQRRFGTACGIGPSFDEGSMDERNHTIMQQAGRQRCVTALGEETSRTCYNADDCEAGESCPLPSLSSEFSVPGNFDLLFGDSSLPADTCPSPRPGDTYRLSGFLGETSAMDVFDDTDLTSAKNTSTAEKAREYIDEIGDVPGYDEGSAHAVWVFPEHTGAQTWTLHFGIDEKHLDGDPDEGLRILGAVDIAFEASPSKTVSEPGEPDRMHRVLESVNGIALNDPAYVAPTIAIPEFANGAAATELTLEFADLEERESWNGGQLSGTDITAGADQQLGVCPDTTGCEQRWNSSTQRWEATDVRVRALQDGNPALSDWEVIVANMDKHYDLTWAMPAGLPAEGPSNCGGVVTFDEDVQGTDQVYIVLDRSYSMTEDREATGDTRTRMEWAQAGARGFVDLLKGNGVDAGLISFSSSASEDVPLRIIEDDGTPGDVNQISDFKAAIDDLTPDGNTAIGDALELARTQLEAHEISGRQQAVMLLSDGQNNDGDFDPGAVAEDLHDADVLVYTVPLGNDADGEYLADIAAQTGAEMLDAPDPLKLPPLFAQTWGRIRGESPIWANVPSATEAVNDHVSATTHVIPVEADSERLSVMLSTRNDDPTSWNPICQLLSPSGQAFNCTDLAVTQVDDFYKILRVPFPEPGIWELQVFGLDQPIQRSYVWAHSENAGPDCWAGAAPRVAREEPADGVHINAVASYVAPLGRGVEYFLQVQTPNGTLLPLQIMSLNDDLNGAEYVFNAFQGRGRYEVTVSCVATVDAKFSPGENVGLEQILGDGQPKPFWRQAKTSFFLDVDDYPPPPSGGDCDMDGIPDTSEIADGGAADSDNDGVQDFCDTDTDGDDVPDQDDQCPTMAEDFDGVADGDGCPDADRDRDQDGIPDRLDNCPAFSNPAQIDSDRDGFGNRCDTDLNNDGVTNLLDLGRFKLEFGTPGPNADFNSDRVVNFLDLGIFKQFFGKPPG